MANSQHSSSSELVDMLAAVALHVLVSEGRKGMSAAQIASACERDPGSPADTRETDAALRVLLKDGLAERSGALFKPTRAAVRAAELSF